MGLFLVIYGDVSWISMEILMVIFMVISWDLLVI